MIEEDQKMM